jgi:hypothetical protein
MDVSGLSLPLCWFVRLNLDEIVWDTTTFMKNKEHLLEAVVAKDILVQVVQRACAANLIWDKHLTVDSDKGFDIQKFLP